MSYYVSTDNSLAANSRGSNTKTAHVTQQKTTALKNTKITSKNAQNSQQQIDIKINKITKK
jgi:hypothetical protein